MRMTWKTSCASERFSVAPLGLRKSIEAMTEFVKHLATVDQRAIGMVMIRTTIIALCFSSISYAQVIIPTFHAHQTQREIFGDQIYHTLDIMGTMWQLNYWSKGELAQPALLQALNDVHAGNKGKFSGVVEREHNQYNLLHVSAGFGKATATLFYIADAGIPRIIAVARHVQKKVNQEPEYEIIGRDPRYNLL